MPFKKAAKRFFLVLVIASIVIGTAGVGGFILMVKNGVWGELPPLEELAAIEHNEGTTVLSADGTEIGRYFLLDRRSTTYEQLPKHLVNALVATEDIRFFEHEGIDYRSLLRVLVKTIILQDRAAGGGSTITQQLAKNLYPREDYTMMGLLVAKVKEAIIAHRLESIYSKEQILSLYLNTVSFPDNTYGIESAAQRWFSKSTPQLDIIESALLIGSLKATSTYNPRNYPDKSKARRNIVLAQMKKYNFLHSDSFDSLSKENLNIHYQRITVADGTAPYFREQVRKQLKRWINENPKPDGSQYNLYTDGLVVRTTLDRGMQKIAEASMRKHMANLQNQFEKEWGNKAPWHNDQWIRDLVLNLPVAKSMAGQGMGNDEIWDSLSVGKSMDLFTWDGITESTASTVDSIRHYVKLLNTGFLAVAPETGAVKAWIGGIDYDYFQYDHVSQAKRQVGSTFKPIVYAAALEKGIEPCQYYSARPVKYENMEGWTPTNDEEERYKNQNLSMRAALTNSVNTVAIKILEETGIEYVVNFARKLNIDSTLPKVPSLALGTADLSVMELASAYTAFLHDRRPVEPYLITSIQDKNDSLLFNYSGAKFSRAMKPETAAALIEMMQSVVNEGTASRLRWKYKLDADIAGKTGTTQSNKDAWFVAVTPHLVTVTWVGADNPTVHFRSTKIGQGANAALPIFGNFYQSLATFPTYDRITKARFAQPSASVRAALDCDPIKEDGFLKKLFTNEDKPKVKDYGEEKKNGLFSKIRKIFKKKGDDGGK